MWGLISVFVLGGIIIVTSIIRISSFALHATTTQITILMAVESSLGIIVACCLPLRIVFVQPNKTAEQYTIPKDREFGIRTRVENGASELDKMNRWQMELVPHIPFARRFLKLVEFDVNSERASQLSKVPPKGRRVEAWEGIRT